MAIRKKENKAFIKLATARVNATINSIAMIKRMAESCHHTPKQVESIFKALRRHIDDCEKAYLEAQKPKNEKEFSLLDTL